MEDGEADGVSGGLIGLPVNLANNLDRIEVNGPLFFAAASKKN